MPMKENGVNSPGDSFSLKGTVIWELRDIETNRLVDSGTQDNLITDKFRAIFQDWITISLANWNAGSAEDIPTHIAFGTSTSTPAIGDTALGGEQERYAIDSKSETSSFGGRMVVNLTTTEGNFGIKEAGLLNAATAGSLFSRVSVDISKTTSEVLNFIWILRIA
jgi:hypothetical protein